MKQKTLAVVSPTSDLEKTSVPSPSVGWHTLTFTRARAEERAGKRRFFLLDRSGPKGGRGGGRNEYRVTKGKRRRVCRALPSVGLS